MKVLFIYPLIPDTFWSYRHALSFVGKKAAFPPLGLLTIAAMAPTTWERRVVDMNVSPLVDTAIDWADLVVLTAMYVQSASVKELMARCARMGKTMAAGGPYFTTAGAEGFDAVDYLFLGEAEETFPQFLADLANGAAKHVYRSGRMPDLALSPVPAWELIDMRGYDSMLVQFSRGCPFDCEFCNITQLNGRTPRTKTPEQFLREIEVLYRRGWRGSVFVVDDNFIGNKAKTKALLRALAAWMDAHGRPFHLFTEASINLADDPELMHLMTRAGFNKVFIGIETPHRESLAEAGKAQNTKADLLDAVKTIHRQGMEVMGGFIVGFDHDPADIFERQIAFIQQSGIIMAMVGMLEAIPGTRLHQRLMAEGRLLETTSGDNTDGRTNFVTVMDRTALEQGYRRLLKGIYAPEDYYRRCVTFLSIYRPRNISKIDRSGIAALFRSMWRMGVRGESGFRSQYWRLLATSLRINPRTLGEAVRLAIVGLHFRTSLLKEARPETVPYEAAEELPYPA